MNQPRSETIRQIIEARRPMAEKARKSEESLHQIENKIRSFRSGLKPFASRLDEQAAAAVLALESEAFNLERLITEEKAKLSLLAERCSRKTLNIGVAGRARQGKSWFLQKLTDLTPDEIPSGDQGHCTGAPSVIVNHASETTYAEIAFHTNDSFLKNVIAPFFARLELGNTPATISEFREAKIPTAPKAESKDPTTDEAFIEKLRFFQDCLDEYEPDLNGLTKRVTKDEIRSYIAQDDKEGKRKNSSGKPYSVWAAVQMATVYCRFPQQDIGLISVADTPGIGDFLSGSDDRLITMIGRNLDSILFLRMPESIGALIKPEDTALHSLVTRSIPNLPIDKWSYFIINKNQSTKGNNLDQIPRFEEMLANSPIRTKKTLVVNCSDQSEVASAFDLILNDISGNLHILDQILFEHQLQSLKALGQSIAAFAEKAATALPKSSVVAPDDTLLNRLFGDVWNNLGFELQELVKEYREKRDDKDEDFLSALKSVFDGLNTGPSLPDQATIRRESAPGTLMKWHADKLNEVRVKVANSFEHLDTCLNSSFNDLRIRILNAFASEKGGALKGLQCPEGSDLWQVILKRLEGLDGGEEMQKAIRQLLSSGLSFRGFIQPRVRKCLDVLDSDSPAAADFEFSAGDSVDNVMEKIGMAWENACFNCKSMIEEMAKEPAMARFAVAEDFREALLHTGGETRSREIWHQFYKQSRPEIWPKEFKQLEAETLMRKEWESMIQALRASAISTGA